MMSMILRWTLLLTSMLLLNACLDFSKDDDDDDKKGDRPDEEDGIGYFIDSPVQGLTYQSSSYSGTTDEDGRYEYEEGETVTFKLGSLILGSVTAAKAIHVSDLFDDPEADDTDTLNLARLLLTLDSDADSDNGIQLSAAAISEANSTEFPSGLDFGSASFALDVANYIAQSGVTNASVSALISAQDAQDHLEFTLAEAEGLKAGCGNECVPRAVFNEYVESVSPRHGETGVLSTISSISIDMTADYDEDMNDLTIEIFGLPTSSNYENCRIDWSGFKCTGFTNQTIFDLHDTILQILNYDTGVVNQEIEFSVNQTTKVLTVTLNTSLKPNHQYTVHVFNDGESGDDDDDKTWWQFTTGAN